MIQAEQVRSRLAETHGVPTDEIEIVVLKTTGDRVVDRPLTEIGGKGLFTKEIEEALLGGLVDMGVHSTKDVATVLPDGLRLAAFLEREDVRDAFVSLHYASVDELPPGARLGSSSLRRAAQMRRYRPDLNVVGFRGNVQTRLTKLADGVADATLLALAGLNRLGEGARAASILDPAIFPPAPAQGAIGIEIREGDERVEALLAPLDHADTALAVRAERAFLRRLDGSCRTAIGAYFARTGGEGRLIGQILSPDGSEAFTGTLAGDIDDAERLGLALADMLLAEAGADFLARFPA